MFVKVIWKQWSLCSISRYTGARQKSLLVGEYMHHAPTCWHHGHFNGNTGVAQYANFAWVSATIAITSVMTHESCPGGR